MSIQATVENIREKFKVRLSFRVDEKGGKNALIYGLCEGVGINTDGMRPKEAWDAYIKKTGKTPDSVFVEKNIDKMDYSELHAVREHIRQKMYKEKSKATHEALLDTFKKLDNEIKKRDKEGFENYQKSKKTEKPKSEKQKKPIEKKQAEKKPTVENSSEPKEVKNPKSAPSNAFSADAYSEERKKNALWSSNPKEVDEKVRGVASKVWLDSNTEERKNAIRYTRFSHQYNDPQREAGAKGDYSAQGQGAEHLTNMINKSSYDFDMKLQRGTTYDGAAKFLGVDDKFLRTASDKELNEALVGREPIEFGFCSTGGAKGYGTTPEDYKSYKVQYQIYAPAGTKMLYAEPFSWYNKYNNDPIDWDMYDWWDGESPQKGGFSREFEMLVQRNTRFRVSRVRRDKKGILWVDLDIISQDT